MDDTFIILSNTIALGALLLDLTPALTSIVIRLPPTLNRLKIFLFSIPYPLTFAGSLIYFSAFQKYWVMLAPLDFGIVPEK